jgi:puromycin-sensitive aminopeptidase
VPKADPHRLPRSVEPTRYDITLKPDLEARTFEGEERVAVVLHEPTAEIALNAADLTIAEATLVAADGTAREGEVTIDEEQERAVVELQEEAPAGAHTLRLVFSGVLNDQLCGFYHSQFADDEGATRSVAATQFEATDARRAFPCWDEPDRKATFAVTLVVDEDLTAVSNSPVVEVTPDQAGKKRVRFAETMRMSTYLVAIVVGPLEQSEPVDVDGVPVRVVCVPGKGHLAKFAMEVATHSLRFFSRYFGIAYPAEKLDLIALPDFAMGAMENLGAVTFRETLLLIDPERATQVELERVADVVAHELAHMWFGDLVTMTWWNGIWLNEAFATFMELLCVDDLKPEWRRWVTFGLSRGSAMVIDGLPSTRPVEFPVSRPEEAEAMFDVLTYQKGAAVLRMLERYVGAEPFREGIADYIAKHSYANTDTSDLWDAIESATGEPARSVMDSWIFHSGYPVVSVRVDGGTIQLQQRRFTYTRGEGGTGDADHGRLWHVPVLLRASVRGEIDRHRLVMDEASASVQLEGDPEWVVANDGGWGFYRVRYEAGLLERLTADVDHLDAQERFNLISDTWASALAGIAPLSDFVALVPLFGNETHPSLWTAMLSPLDLLERMLAAEDRQGLQRFVRDLVHPAFDRLGWAPEEVEGETTRTLRGTLLRALGVLGADAAVHEEAREVHRRYLEEDEPVDPDVAAAVLAIVAATGGEEEYEAFLERYRNPATPQEEVRYLYALADFRAEQLLRRTFELALSEVRTQNGPFLVSLLLSNRSRGELAWELVKQHWDELLSRYPDALHDRMLEGVTTLTRPEVAADVRSFLSDHPLPVKTKAVEQILERLQVAVAFREREESKLSSVFESQSQGRR